MPKSGWKDRLPTGKEGVFKVVAAGAGLSFIGAFLDRGLGYLTRIVIARSMTPSEYGLLFLAFSLLSVATTFAVFQMNAATKRYAAYYRGKKDYSSVKGAITSALKISVPISLASFAILFILSDFISAQIFTEPAMGPVLRIMSFILLFAPAIEICISATQAFQSAMYDVLARKIGKTVITLAALVVVLWAGLGVGGAAAAYVIGYAFTAALSVYFLTRVFPIFSIDVKGTSMKRKLFSFAWPVLLYGIIWNFNGELGTLILGALREGTLDVGIFQSALPSARFLMMIPSALTALFVPITATMFAQGKKEQISKVSRTTFRWMFFLNLPLFMVMLLYPNVVMNTLFGAEYMAAGPVLSVLSIGFFLYPMSAVSVGMLQVYEKTRLHLLNSVVCIAVNASLAYVLIPFYGSMGNAALGAAIATTAMFIVYITLYMIEGYRISGVSPISKSLARSVIAGSGAGAFILAIDVAVPVISLPVLIPAFIGFILVYTTLLMALGGLEREDIELLKRIEKKTGLKMGPIRRVVKRLARQVPVL